VVNADCSLACSLGEHHDCVHNMYASTGAREGQVALCSCDCHESCPVGGRDAASFLEWRFACTCPGTEGMRRAQDQAGADPEVLARQFESYRRELAGADTRSEMGKRALVKGYEAAAAQAAGQPVDPDDAMENPQRAMQLIADTLASIESEAAAARRLGVSEAQVAELRESAREFRAGIIRGLIGSRRKRHKWWGN
jgi:hypothetical protein